LSQPKTETGGTALATWLWGAGLLLLFCLLCLLMTGGGLDDAYITYRYARHLAQGHGAVWNVGEPPVEGYTSFLWVALNAVALRLDSLPLLASKALATASGFAMMLLALFFPGPLESRAWRVALAAMFASCPLLAFYAQSGMETVFFTALLFAAVLLLLHALSGPPRPGTLAAASLLFGLSAMTRPEGVMMFGLSCVLLLSLWLLSARDKLPRHWPWLLLGPFLAVWLTYFLWRLQKYGWLFPNTYYAKHSGNRLQNLPLGLTYLANAWSPYLAVPVTLLASVGVLRSQQAEGLSSLKDRLVLRLAAVCLCYVLYIVWVGGDDRSAFPSSRLFLPFLPLLWLATVLLFDVTSRTWSPRVRNLTAGGVVLLLAAGWGGDTIALLKFFLPGGTSPSGLPRAKVEQLLSQPAGELPGWIQRNTRPEEFIAVPWAGRVPYFSERPTLDMLGLNDVHIAHLPARQRGIDVKMDPAYILSRRPKLIFINVEGCYWKGTCTFEQAGGWKLGDRELLDLLRGSSEYEWVEDAPVSISVFRRRDRPGEPPP
jgi:hypothetical protein